MSKNKAFYIDFNKGGLVDQLGGNTFDYPEIIYKSEPVWELHFVDFEDRLCNYARYERCVSMASCC